MSVPPADNETGWIKLHRRLWKHPRARDPAWVTVWAYLLSNATHKQRAELFDGNIIELRPGQLVTGRHAIAKATGVHESKVRRVLKTMVSDQQLDQQAGVKGSVFTVRNWKLYQASDQQLDQRAASKRPTTSRKPTSELTSNHVAQHPITAGLHANLHERVTNKPTSDGSKHTGKAATNKKARKEDRGDTHTAGDGPPTRAEVKGVAKRICVTEDATESFIAHFEAENWCDRNGKPVTKRNLEAKLRAWRHYGDNTRPTAKRSPKSKPTKGVF